MNKKVLSAILFSALFAGTGTFTSCIDNDEPEGIENLRGAKAELIRAKVAVEAANATYKLAEAEVQKAEAAIKNAQAELKKALAEEQELKNELLSIQNEEARFDLEQKIAAAELASKEAQLAHEIAMTKLNEQLASAKRNYELFLAHLEIAKATLADKDVVALFELENAADKAQGAVEDAQAKVKAAEDNYYLATLDAKKGEVIIKRYENQVTIAEDALAVAQEAYEKWNDLLSEDAETADWTAEITTLEDSIKGLEKKQVELTVELAKLQNAEAYKNLIDAENAANYAYNNHKAAAKYETAKIHTTAKKTIAKGSMVSTALTTIAGSDWDGKGGYIKEYADLIAGYTTEKKAVLDLIKASYDTELAKAKKDSDDATAAWTAAKTAYADAQTNAVNVSFDAAKAAKKAYDEDIAAIGEMTKKPGETDVQFAARKLNAEMKAKQTFADAMVAFYNTIPANQITYNKLTLEVTKTVNGTPKTECVTQTVKDWLSDEDKDVWVGELLKMFDNNIEAFYGFGKQREGVYSYATGLDYIDNEEHPYAKNAFLTGSLKTKQDMIDAALNDLKSKSTAAFGDELLVGDAIEKGFMQVVPTDEEVKSIENYGQWIDTDNDSNVDYLVGGKLGYYVWMKQESTQYEAKNYEAIIASYTEAKAYWTEVATTLMAENKALYDAAVAAADAKVAYEEENFDAIYKEIYGEIGGRIAALTRIKNALASAVTSYLQVDYANFDGTVKFEEWLKEQAADAKLDVFSAEEDLIKAQNDLTKVQDGKVDVWAVLAEAEEELADAMAELEAAQAELNTALDNLAKGLEIIAALNAAE